MSLSGGGSDTTIELSEGDRELDLDLRQATGFLTVGYTYSPRWSFSASLGTIFDGSANGSDVGFGGGGSLGASYLWLYETSRRPFLQVSFSLAASLTSAVILGEREPLVSGDGRVGLLLGKTFFDRLSVFAAARVFGGPVFFDGLMGGDAHHYTVGAGAILRLPGMIDVFVEAMPLGEQSFSVGGGVAF